MCMCEVCMCVVCMCMCEVCGVHVYVCDVMCAVCMCMCVCLWRPGAMSEVFSSYSPSLHQGRVSRQNLEITDIVSPACSRNPLSLLSWC